MLPLPSPPPSYVYGALAGAVLHHACLRLSPVLTERLGTAGLRRRIAALDRGRRSRYHALLPSTVHALVQVVGTFHFVVRDGMDGVPATSFDERTFVDYGPTRLGPAAYMGIFVGYLLADVAAAPSLSEFGRDFAVHHLAAAACWTFSVCHRVMQPAACLLQFCEISTPLMNARQYLLAAGYASSDAPVKVTSLMFFVTFGLARVGQLPFVLRDWAFRDCGAIAGKLGTGGAALLSAFFALNAAMQCGWFFVMCRKLAAALGKERSKFKTE